MGSGVLENEHISVTNFKTEPDEMVVLSGSVDVVGRCSRYV